MRRSAGDTISLVLLFNEGISPEVKGVEPHDSPMILTLQTYKLTSFAVTVKRGRFSCRDEPRDTLWCHYFF